MNLKNLLKISNIFKIIILLENCNFVNEKDIVAKFDGVKNIFNCEEYNMNEHDVIYFCKNNEMKYILKQCKIIKNIYPSYSDDLIYVSMIYSYYLLNQEHHIYISVNHVIEDFKIDKDEMINLIYDITIRDIIFEEINISSNIRQAFLFGNYR